MSRLNLFFASFLVSVFLFQANAQQFSYSLEELPTIQGDMKMNDAGKLVSISSNRLNILSNGVWQEQNINLPTQTGLMDIDNSGTVLARYSEILTPTQIREKLLRVKDSQIQYLGPLVQEFSICDLPNAGTRLCSITCDTGVTGSALPVSNNFEQTTTSLNCFAKWNSSFTFVNRQIAIPSIWNNLTPSLITIPSLTPPINSSSITQSNSINDSGVVVGKDNNRVVNSIPQRSTAVVWDSTNGIRYLDSIIPTTPTFFAFENILKINNKGWIVASYTNEAGTERGLFFWDNNTVTKITDQGFNVVGLNDNGEVVGNYSGYPVIWDKVNGLRNINTLLPVGQNIVLVGVGDINYEGNMLVYGTQIGSTVGKKFLLKKFRTPVIFVPGTLGSVVEGPPMSYDGPCSTQTTYWISLFASTLCTANLRLTNDPQSRYYTPNLVATDALRSALGQQVYGPILQMFLDNGYKEYNTRLAIQRGGSLAVCDTAQASNNPNFFVFPYDFRKDNAESSQKLKIYIQCVKSFFPPNTKIDIVAHSQGGIVTRRYILQSQAAGQPHGLRKVITIATPFLGASEAMYKMETGGNWEAFSFGVITPPTIKFLVKHFPSAHQLLPSRKYFEFASFDPDALGAFYEIGDANGNGNEGEGFDFDQTKDFLNNQFSTNPGTTGSIFHDFSGQDDWTQDQSGIDYNHIIATQYGFTTTVAVNMENYVSCISNTPNSQTCSESTVFNPVKGKGDATVPNMSASRVQFRDNGMGGYNKVNLNSPTSNRWYMWAISPPGSESFTNDNKLHEHNGITQNPTTHQLVLAILGLTSIPKGFGENLEVPPNQLLQNTVNIDLSQNKSSPIPPTTYPNSYYFKLIGIQQAEVSDASGNHTTINGEIFTNNVNGLLNYERIGEKSIFLTMTVEQEHSVQFVMGNEPISLEIVKGVGNKKPNNAIRYKDIMLPVGTQVKIVFTTNGVANLQYDADNNGTFESVLQPDVNVTGVNARDIKPPSVVISAAQQGSNGTITITATDAESGLKNIKYSINGTNFVNYSQPFTVDASNPVTISAFAEDNVFNRSSVIGKTFFTNLVSIKGRVISNGFFPSSSRVFLTLTKVNTGETFISKTNQLGYYRFKGVAIGENYIIAPIPIYKHSFGPVKRQLFVNSNLNNIDFNFDF